MSRFKYAHSNLSDEQIGAIRAEVPAMLLTQSLHSIAHIYSKRYEINIQSVKMCVKNDSWYDADYTPPVIKVLCPSCDRIRLKFTFYYKDGTSRGGVCKKCDILSGRRRRVYDKHMGVVRREKEKRVRIAARKKRGRLRWALKKKPRRDPIESQQYQCRVCSMGVNMKGKAFQSQHDADQCCAGTEPIYRHSVLQTRGRFMMFNDRI